MADGKATVLTVVRHGETVWNQSGRQQGWLDTDLTELGRAQAKTIASGLAGETFEALYSSDLGRAMQTADIIAAELGKDVIPVCGLRERNLGILQGLTIAQFQQGYPEEYERFTSGNPDYRLPQGESIRERYKRQVGCAEELAGCHTGGHLLVVAHGGVLNSLFRHAVGLDIASLRRFYLLNASINVFSVADGCWKLERWGDTHHLGELDTHDDW